MVGAGVGVGLGIMAVGASPLWSKHMPTQHVDTLLGRGGGGVLSECVGVNITWTEGPPEEVLPVRTSIKSVQVRTFYSVKEEELPRGQSRI